MRLLGLFFCFYVLTFVPPVFAQDADAEGVDALQTYKVSAFVSSFPAVNRFNEQLVEDDITPLFAVPDGFANKHEVGVSGLVLEEQVLELKQKYPKHYNDLKDTLREMFDANANQGTKLHDFETPEKWAAYGDRVLLAHGAVTSESGSTNLRDIQGHHNNARDKIQEMLAQQGLQDMKVGGKDITTYMNDMINKSQTDTSDVVTSYTIVSDHDRGVVEPFSTRITMQLQKYN